ncbi:Rho GTPase-activating protein [Simkania sp.]|uniref:Rho GTPase-activating protein n=1 Tax=Simkania sp. TaxID=34094 RepID=UPI003B52CF9C
MEILDQELDPTKTESSAKKRAGYQLFSRLDKMLDRLETDFLACEGLYRKPAPQDNLDNKRRELLDLDKSFDVDQINDPHILANLVKEMIKTDIPDGIFASIPEGYNSENTLDQNREAAAKAIKNLPKFQRKILARLVEHSIKVSGNSEVNKMNLPNLATVFGPNLFQQKYGLSSEPANFFQLLAENPAVIHTPERYLPTQTQLAVREMRIDTPPFLTADHKIENRHFGHATVQAKINKLPLAQRQALKGIATEAKKVLDKHSPQINVLGLARELQPVLYQDNQNVGMEGVSRGEFLAHVIENHDTLQFDMQVAKPPSSKGLKTRLTWADEEQKGPLGQKHEYSQDVQERRGNYESSLRSNVKQGTKIDKSKTEGEIDDYITDQRYPESYINMKLGKFDRRWTPATPQEE